MSNVPLEAKWDHGPYPQGRSFGELLDWHLVYWGTTSKSTKTEQSEPGKLSAFAQRVYKDSKKPEPAGGWEGNLRTWRLQGRLPHSYKLLNNILWELFGDNPDLSDWKDELAAAYKREKKAKKSSEISDEPDSIGSPSPVATTHLRPSDPYRHIDAAARDDESLVTRKLKPIFAGRGDDIAAINQFVADRMVGGSKGLLVVTAPAGYGKSALAVHWVEMARGAQNRRVAAHFCSMSNGALRTQPKNIYADLHQQIAKALNEPLDPADDFSAIQSLLLKTPPHPVELIVWLDGIDEANGKIDCFLPFTLGSRVCVIVSARAEAKTTPPYLAPWLVEERARSNSPGDPYCLEKLSFFGVRELVNAVFKQFELPVPDNLDRRIFNASDGGYALIARSMAETAAEAVQENKEINLGSAPESLLGYARSELDRLEALDEWATLLPIFAHLTVTLEAITVTDLQTIIGAPICPKSFPHRFSRWLNLSQNTSGHRYKTMLSFTHPKLAEVFGVALDQVLDGAREAALASLCDVFDAMPHAKWPEYAWRHWPRHLLDAGRLDRFVARMTDFEFIAARMDALGVEAGVKAMATDWMRWNGARGRMQPWQTQ